jgi:hypothetical protein
VFWLGWNWEHRDQGGRCIGSICIAEPKGPSQTTKCRSKLGHRDRTVIMINVFFTVMVRWLMQYSYCQGINTSKGLRSSLSYLNRDRSSFIKNRFHYGHDLSRFNCRGEVAPH